MRILFLLICLHLVFLTPGVVAKPFNFVALGDTAYNLEKDLPIYTRLIEKINASKPAFTIHVGDTWGAATCTEERQLWVKGWFDRYQQPLIYTPGDNEWTDCRNADILASYTRFIDGKATPADMQRLGRAQQLDALFAGSTYTDTLKSLGTIRKVFFSEPLSQGQKKIPLIRQSDVSTHIEMAENAQWQKSGVHFATVHVPGSGNGFTINDPVRAAEAIKRNRANVDWIKRLFADAQEQEAKAVVIALHASLFEKGRGREFADQKLRGGEEGAFYWIALAIRDLGAKFGKPVLLINGDFHEFIIDRPFVVSQGEQHQPKYANITRLQVFGAPELKAVNISVDPDTDWVFSFSPLY